MIQVLLLWEAQTKISKRDIAISNESSEEELTNKEDLDNIQVGTNFNFRLEWIACNLSWIAAMNRYLFSLIYLL